MKLSIVWLENAKDEEIEDLFLRHNGGTSLNAPEKRRGLASVTDLVEIITKTSHTESIFANPDFVKKASDIFGSSTIVVSIDVKSKITSDINN